MREEKEILLRGNVCAYLTCRLMGDPLGFFILQTRHNLAWIISFSPSNREWVLELHNAMPKKQSVGHRFHKSDRKKLLDAVAFSPPAVS